MSKIKFTQITKLTEMSFLALDEKGRIWTFWWEAGRWNKKLLDAVIKE